MAARPRRLLRQLTLSQPTRSQAAAWASHAQATIHSLRRRAWASRAQSPAQATTHLHLARAWVVRVSVLVAQPVDQVAQVAQPVVQVAQVAHLVRAARQAALHVRVAALLAQVALQALVASTVQAVALRVLVVSHVQRVAQVAHQAVAAAMPLVPLVPSVRVARAVPRRRVRASVQSAKNSKQELMLQASVVHWYRAATATPYCVCAAVRASRTLQTRLMQMLVS